MIVARLSINPEEWSHEDVHATMAHYTPHEAGVDMGALPGHLVRDGYGRRF